MRELPDRGTVNRYMHWDRCRCDRCTDAMRVYRKKKRAERLKQGLEPGDPRHGTAAAYREWGCHCDACTLAHNKALGRWRAKAAERGLPPDSEHHGTLYGYQTYACRCDRCRRANADRSQRTREMRTAQ